MSVVSELLRTEANGTISFGDYSLATKAKLDNYKYNGEILKVKTCKEITKLESNEMFVYESVPGTAVTNFSQTEDSVSFEVEGPEDAQITLEVEEDSEYEVSIGGKSTGTMKPNMGGKLSLSVELQDAGTVAIKVLKK